MRLASLLAVLALACNPDGGDSSTGATSTTGSTGASASASSTSGGSATTGASTSSTTAVSDPTTGASASASSTVATTTADPSTSTTTTAGTTAVTASTGAQTSGDTGGPATCGVADADYGDCDLALGVAFDGSECAPRSGCDCAPDCDKFFPDLASCALACAEAGHCNPARIKAAGIAKDPIEPGDLCDEIDVCPGASGLESVFEQIFGMLSCEPGLCKGGQTCHGLWQNMLGPEEWKKTCAASLVQGSGDILCVVFGP